MTKIDMQTMRYINLLSDVAKVKTTNCFIYNEFIIFAVPVYAMQKAVGPAGRNVRIIEQRLGKRVKVIREANGINEARRFIEDIVSPVGFVSLELRENIFVLTAGARSKAMLLGRNKRRYEELKSIFLYQLGRISLRFCYN